MSSGTWLLVQCYDQVPNQEEPEVAKNTGYNLFKDKSIVVFYTNDLADTPDSDISGCKSQQAVKCVYGLSRLKRWLGNEIFHRTVLKLPRERRDLPCQYLPFYWIQQ